MSEKIISGYNKKKRSLMTKDLPLLVIICCLIVLPVLLISTSLKSIFCGDKEAGLKQSQNKNLREQIRSIYFTNPTAES